MKKKATNLAINRIKVVLVEKGMLQKDLAEALGQTDTAISRICKNSSQPSLRQLHKIAKILDVDIRELLNPTKY